MRNKILQPNFPPYNLPSHTKYPLLLLFTLQELLHIFSLLETLKQSPSPQNIQKLLSLHNSFQQNGGALDKLCFYCETLLQVSHGDHIQSELTSSDPNAEYLLQTKKNGEKTTLPHPTVYDLENQEIASVLEEIKVLCCQFQAEEVVEKDILPFFNRISERLICLFHRLLPHFSQLRSDENLLMYLVEKKDDFNHYLGAHSIERILCHLYPRGINELKHVIFQGYSKRGFSHIFMEKKSLIDDLELNPPCPPPKPAL